MENKYLVKSTVIRQRRRMISAYGKAPQQPRPPCRNGPLSGWTPGMSRRLGSFLENFREDFTGMITLTYPGLFPRDGKIVKAHLRAFTERLRRTGWLERYSFVWFLEFQDRGAPHFHLLCTGFLGKDWIARSWSEITGGRSDACSRVEAIRNPNASGAYARKYARKNEQKMIPEDFRNVGRMWGCSGPALKTIQGIDWERVPCVEAYTTFPLYLVAKAIRTFSKAYKIGRFYESEGGIAFYGSTLEVEEMWRLLRGAELFAEEPETRLGKLQQRSLVDLLG